MVQEHPRKPVGTLWLALSLVATAALWLLRAGGGLPLSYARKVGALSLPATLPVAFLIGAALCLPLALWLTNLGHWRRILRPTKGKIAAALALSLLVPGLITETGQPYMIGPVYLFIALTSPSASTLALLAIYFALALAVLYPVAAVLLWGLQRKARPLALLGLPAGLYGLLYLMGGTF